MYLLCTSESPVYLAWCPLIQEPAKYEGLFLGLLSLGPAVREACLVSDRFFWGLLSLESALPDAH